MFKNSNKIFCSLFSVFMAISSGELHAEEKTSVVDKSKKLIFVSDPYPPYVIDDGGENHGYVADVTLLIFKKAGFDVEYQNVPFKRALFGIESGSYTGLLAVSPGREGYIYPESSIGNFRNVFFVRSDSEWKWNGVSSLNGVVYGGILGYSLDSEYINPYVEKYKNDPDRVQLVSGSDALRSNILKLASGRIDVFFEDYLVAEYTAKKLNLSEKIKVGGVDESQVSQSLFKAEPVTVGFHASNPDAKEYIRIFEAGLADIRKTGELDVILKNYGLEEFVE